MIVVTNNPTSVDFWIKKVQPMLESSLFKKWGATPTTFLPGDASYIFYPRVHRNPLPAPGGFVAELYTGNGNYKEVYWDDKLAGLSWFGLGPKTVHDVQQVADVHLVTFANLKKLYPGALHRADMEIRGHFEEFFQGTPFGFTLLSTEIWLQNVLREYPGSRRDDRLIKADMGEVHAFRLNLQLRYVPAESCENPFL